MAIIKKNHLVQKRNILNEIRSNSMTLQELRFFSIYLSRINPFDISTRIVRFPIDDFRAIMDLGRINIDYMKGVTNSLLSKVVNVPTERGGYTGFQLFKDCTVDTDKNSEWYIEIDAHDKALPLMFEFKNNFFSYRLWNALRLKSSNQLRMYELLKQYEKAGYRIFTIENLRANLGIDKEEYTRFNNFKQWVIDPCQQALEENTDIKFTYEPHGRRGRGGKIIALKFTILKNEHYVDQLSLDEFIRQSAFELEEKCPKPYNGRLEFLMEACNNEFSESEVEILYLIVRDKVKSIDFSDELALHDYFHRKYREMEMRSQKTKIKNRYGYLKKIIEADGMEGE